jgi:hypothetical protein
MVREPSHSHIQEPHEKDNDKAVSLRFIETPASAANCDRSHRDGHVHLQEHFMADHCDSNPKTEIGRSLARSPPS